MLDYDLVADEGVLMAFGCLVIRCVACPNSLNSLRFVLCFAVGGRLMSPMCAKLISVLI